MIRRPDWARRDTGALVGEIAAAAAGLLALAVAVGALLLLAGGAR